MKTKEGKKDKNYSEDTKTVNTLYLFLKFLLSELPTDSNPLKKNEIASKVCKTFMVFTARVSTL